MPLSGGETLARFRRRHTPHQQAHQPEKGTLFGPIQGTVGSVVGRFSSTSHSVWGRVVADIPDFNRELVAALASQ